MTSETPRILIVDDDDNVVELCARALAMDGYDVETAASADEVLKRGSLLSYQILLTDIRMPGQDGLSLIRGVKQRNPHIEIIVMAGYPTTDHAIEALREGVYDFVIKPFTMEGVRQVVKKCLEKVRLTQDLARTNEALARVNQDLERTNYLQTQFLSLVSHELRAPLNVITRLSELLLEKRIPPGQLDETVHNIRQESIRMKKLMETLYDFSRLRAGKVTLKLEPLDTREVVKGYVDLLAPQFAGREVTVLIPPGLPPVLADRDRFIQIFTNLLLNAVKFSPPDSQITVKAIPWKSRTGRESVRISVHDQGPGIPSEEIPYIFEAFYRGPGADDAASAGLGLGLSIVKAVVELMGGEIEVKSSPGKGSKFIVTLPLAAGHAPLPREAGGKHAVPRAVSEKELTRWNSS